MRHDLIEIPMTNDMIDANRLQGQLRSKIDDELWDYSRELVKKAPDEILDCADEYVLRKQIAATISDNIGELDNAVIYSLIERDDTLAYLAEIFRDSDDSQNLGDDFSQAVIGIIDAIEYY